MEFPRDFRMKIRLLTPEEGGRKVPLLPGTMGRDLFDHPEISGGWGVWFTVEETLELGESRIVEAAPLVREISQKFHPGLRFFLNEGPHQVLECEVLERLDD